jgi:hypothetical protein
MPNTTPTINYLPRWVLLEPVDVTLVHQDADTLRSIYLVTATRYPEDEPAAIVLTFDEGNILLNGVYVDLSDDMIAVCSLVDDAASWTGASYTMALGVTYRSVPYSDPPAEPRRRDDY